MNKLFSEAIITQVIVPDKEDSVEFELIYDNSTDVFKIKVDGKEICSGGWSVDFEKFLKEALTKWELKK